VHFGVLVHKVEEFEVLDLDEFEEVLVAKLALASTLLRPI